MKRTLSVILALLCLGSSLFIFTSCSSEEVEKIYFYNWGEYISDGSEGSEDILALFEEWYYETYGKRVQVVYSMFTNNEELYAKMKNSSTTVDLIIPSDYMVSRMIEEDMLEKLNYDNIPNIKSIDPQFMTPGGQTYDLTVEYTVPYTYSFVGLIYNKNLVDEEDIFDEDGNVIASWRLLWDEKYSGQILNFNNYRDAFGIGQYLLSYETGHTSQDDNYVNTNDLTRWDETYDLLSEQHDVIQAYVMDEVFNKMESGAAALAPYYVGDYYTMYDATYDETEEDSFLGFVYPYEGTNIFVDAMCIPKGAKHKELAECLINFLIDPDVVIGGEHYNIARENAEYICYGTPVLDVTSDEDYDFFEDELLYPDIDEMNTYYFNNLDAKTLSYANGLWEKLKVESAPGVGIYVCAIVIVTALAAVGLFFLIRKRQREKLY